MSWNNPVEQEAPPASWMEVHPDEVNRLRQHITDIHQEMSEHPLAQKVQAMLLVPILSMIRADAEIPTGYIRIHVPGRNFVERPISDVYVSYDDKSRWEEELSVARYRVVSILLQTGMPPNVSY